MKSFNIVVCASGGGGNFRSLIKYQCDYGYHISLLIVDRECPAIKIAKENGISYSVLEKKVLGKSFFEEFEKIVPIDTNLIVLAGFLPIIPKWICEKWERKIINIHPSLIPSFCGKGYYGEKVHQGVIDYGAKVTGATVHFVDEGADTGAIIMQETVNVEQDDDAKSLAKRVLEVEHRILKESIRLFCENKLSIQGRRVFINE